MHPGEHLLYLGDQEGVAARVPRKIQAQGVDALVHQDFPPFLLAKNINLVG
jgi:hypothetical protein